MRPLLALALLVAPALLAGCLDDTPESLRALVPYPRYGDVATYAVSGPYLELARWENGAPFPSGQGQVRFSVKPSGDVLDGARHVHPAFLVQTERNSGGGFVTHAERYVSPRHEGVVQAWYPLSQDQAVLSFDERGFPWLFGASALFGFDPTREPQAPFALPDNLGREGAIGLAWRVAGEEDVEGVATTRFDLVGHPSVGGSLWMEEGSPWPVRARLELRDDGLAPHVRAQADAPVAMEARRVALVEGAESVPPRDRSAGWNEDAGAPREAWDGEKPPEGDGSHARYLLAEAVRDAKLLDAGLAAWLAGAQEPRVYRATYQEDAGPAQGALVPNWLVQFVDRENHYYEVEVERATHEALGVGVPRVTRSGAAQAPADENHGWFAREDVPERLVPLSEGARIVRDVFGAEGVQIFLRSFVDPAGYSYFLDGGFEREGGRYTVVYHPSTGFIEQATGPVTPRFAETS